MPGTHSGGVATAKRNKKLYGDDFYIKLGAKGGAKSRGGGFTGKPDQASRAGHKGGNKSGEVRRAKRDNYLTPLLEQGWRYQDRDLLPPSKLNKKRAAYYDKRREAGHRDADWDKKYGLLPYGAKKKQLTSNHN